MITVILSQNNQQVGLWRRRRLIEDHRVHLVHHMNTTTVLSLQNQKAIRVAKNIHQQCPISKTIPREASWYLKREKEKINHQYWKEVKVYRNQFWHQRLVSIRLPQNSYFLFQRGVDYLFNLANRKYFLTIIFQNLTFFIF